MATAVVMSADATNAALDELIETGAFDGSGDLILTTRGGSNINAGSPIITIPDADTTTKGLVELATTAETTAGSDSVRAVTPAGLDATLTANVPGKVPSASTTVQGKVELATDAEATTGTDTARACTPANVAAVVAANNTTATTSSSGQGVVKLSWSAVSGRAYRIRSNGLHLTGGANDEVAARVFMTTTGVDPTTSDTEVCTLPRNIVNAGRYELVTVNELVVAGSTATHKVTLFVARTAGTAGNAKIDATGVNIKFWVEDCGVPVADAGSGADV